jgi:hypothetical protein
VSGSQPPSEPQLDWRRVYAFGLPEGSIRAVLAVAVFATIWVLLVQHADHEVPDHLRSLLFIIMGHDFAVRRSPVAAGPGPLFLPRGSIRLILYGGFVLVGILLFRQGRFREVAGNPSVVTLLLVAGFLLGVVVARVGEWRIKRGHPMPRWVEDMRAGVALVAAIALIILIWTRMSSEPYDAASFRFGRYDVEPVLSALVGFCFGSRS